MNPEGEVTILLAAWGKGDQNALNELMPLVYNELHRIARRAWIGQDQPDQAGLDIGVGVEEVGHLFFLSLPGLTRQSIQRGKLEWIQDGPPGQARG